MARVLVLGGGFGGVSTAVALRERLATSDEVVLIDRRDDFVMGLRKTWHVLGISPLAYGTRHLAGLEARGITFLHGEITAIHPAELGVEVGADRLEADAVIVALGARHDTDTIPGLAEHAFSTWSPEVLDRAHAAIDGFRGGRLVIGIMGAPYSCPPAPFELALLLADRLEEREIDAEISVVGPGAIPLPLLEAGAAPLEERLAQRGIAYLGSRTPTRVEAGRLAFASHDALPFDLLLAVPPHRVPAVVVAAGMAEPNGWIAVDRSTLETAWPGVHAIGDCVGIGLSNGMTLPKAGLFAEREGTVVAERIAAHLRGETPSAAFDGVGACYVEMGSAEAAVVEGAFFEDPPRVALSSPSADQRAAKERFESERLARWFGA